MMSFEKMLEDTVPQDPDTYTDTTAKGILWLISITILTHPGLTVKELAELAEVGGYYFVGCLRDLLAFGYISKITKEDYPRYYPTAKLRARHPNFECHQVVDDNGELAEYEDVF